MRIRNTFLLLVGLAKFAVFAAKEEVEPDIKFSLPGGFYDDDIELEITARDPQAVIYYTLDGTNPTEESLLYEKPISLTNKTPDPNVHSNHTGITQPGGGFGAFGGGSTEEWLPHGQVNKGNIVRAISVSPAGEISNITSSSYFVGLDKNKLYQDLPIVSVITDPGCLFDYETGIYILGKQYDDAMAEGNGGFMFFAQGNFNTKGKEAERPATIQYIPGDSNEVALTQDVGIKLKGRSTRAQYQKSFNVNARNKYGKKNIKYPLIPGNVRADGTGPVEKYKSFNLRNAGNDSESAKMRDVIIQGLIKNPYFETQQNTYAIVFIDGEYWGIYEIYEEYNDNYIANNYDIEDENVITVKEGAIDEGNEEDIEYFNDLINFVVKNDMAIEENYQEATKKLDMTAYALYCAFNVYVDVQDGYYRGGNNAMWRVREPVEGVPKADGRWRPMAYDTEFSTGMFNMVTGYNKSVLSEISNPNNRLAKNTNPRLTNALLRSDEWRNMFINYLCDVANINYSKDKVLKYINDTEDLLLPLVEEHIQRNGPEAQLADPIASFKNEVDVFRTYMVNRNEVFISLIQADFHLSDPVKVTVSVNDYDLGGFAVNDYNEFEEDYTGEYFKENILYITAKPKDGKSVKSWGLKHCKLAAKKPNTIGFYPNEGCTLTINYE